MKIKHIFRAAVAVILFALVALFITVSPNGPDTTEVAFGEFRTNAAGRLEAFYRVPLPNSDRTISLNYLQRLRGVAWTNEVTLHTERVVGDPTLVWVPLSAGGEPPRPGDVCRVVVSVASQSWSFLWRTLFQRVKQRGVAPFHYDRLRWITNEIYIPHVNPSERAKGG